MCAMVTPSWLAIAGAVTTIASDLRGAATGSESDLCFAAACIDAVAIRNTLVDPWCANNPISCGYNLVSQGVCLAQECLGSTLSPNPYYVRLLAAVCAAGPILTAEIERRGYYSLCVQHIEREISVPINPQQGCFCDRQEMFDPGIFSSYRACGPSEPWTQIGTAQVNCRDHDSDWLPVASGACVAAGASNGDSFYRYSNCRFVTSADLAGWAQFQNYLQQRQQLLRLQSAAVIAPAPRAQ
jgi:hypothetical protein